jgi:hypothetical protein
VSSWPPIPPFPDIDYSQLTEAIWWLITGQVQLSGDEDAVNDLLRSLSRQWGTWEGRAHSAWTAVGKQAVHDLGQIHKAFGRLKDILRDLEAEVAAKRVRYEVAVDALKVARMTADKLQSVIDRTPTPLRSLEVGVAVEVGLAKTLANDLLESVQAEIDHAHDAGHRAQARLSEIVGMLDGIGRFSGQNPAGPVDPAGDVYPPDTMVLNAMGVLLWGGIAENSLAGNQFENDVLKRLGMGGKPKVKYRATLANGRTVGTYPDGVGDDDVIEVKGWLKLHLRSQIRAQLAVARAMGKSYTIVVDERTGVTNKLVEDVHNHEYGGEIVRAKSDGTFTDLAGNEVEKAQGGGWRYPPGTAPTQGNDNQHLQNPNGTAGLRESPGRPPGEIDPRTPVEEKEAPGGLSRTVPEEPEPEGGLLRPGRGGGGPRVPAEPMEPIEPVGPMEIP